MLQSVAKEFAGYPKKLAETTSPRNPKKQIFNEMSKRNLMNPQS